MKNFIFVNYGISIERLYKKNGQHFFFINDIKIKIIKYKGDEKYLSYLYEITNELYLKNNPVDTFIINNNNKYYTKKDDYYLLLLKVNNKKNGIVELNDFNGFNVNSKLKSYNILNEWIFEVDILEKELIEYNKEYNIIKNSFDFFVGLAENAIEIMVNYEQIIDKYNNSIGHKLTYKLFENGCLYNPFTFIKVNKMYDISNYIKYKFITNSIDFNEIYNIFLKCNEYEVTYLYSCLLYPTFYFDLIKKILIKEESEEKLLYIIKKIEKYKIFLAHCKSIVKSNDKIKIINWIN